MRCTVVFVIFCERWVFVESLLLVGVLRLSKKYFSLFSFHLSRMKTKNDEPYSLIRFEWNFKVGKVWNHSFAFVNCAHTFIEKRFFIKREGFWCATKKHKSTERYRLSSSSSSVRFQQIVLCKNTFTANLMHRKRKTPAIVCKMCTIRKDYHLKKHRTKQRHGIR